MAARLMDLGAVDVTGRAVMLDGLAEEQVLGSVRRLLDGTALCALATVAPDGRAHVNTVHFCRSDALELFFLSHPNARHSRNLEANAGMAVAVYTSSQEWGGDDEGLQLFGSCAAVGPEEVSEAERLYGRRFARYVAWRSTVEPGTAAGEYRFYRFRPERFQLLSEREYGPALFVRGSVRG